jgi:type 1 fimbria pilin
MKTFKHHFVIAMVILLVFTAQALNAQQGTVTIKGKVVDATTGMPLVFATVAVAETNVAIVTNIDGEFTLKISESEASKNLEVSYLGYKNKKIALSDLKADNAKNTISLETAPIPI